MLSIKCPKCGSSNWVYSGYRKEEDGTKSQRFFCKDHRKEFRDVDILPQMPGVDIELLRENIRLAKQKVYFRDRNRIERKSFTEYARLDNATSDYSQELVKLLEKYNLAEFTIQHKNYQNNAVGIFHLTDCHFNELVSLASNKYDFNVASKRCKLFVEEAREYFKLKNIKSVLFAITGDILNSDRRLDELLSEATNRSKATFLAVRLIQLMILDLNRDFNITVASVAGNESRVQKDIAWGDMVASDNYDVTVFNILSYLFKGSIGIHFVESENALEQIIRIMERNILLIHGHALKGNIEKAIQGIKGKYSARGIIIDFVILGHLHCALISDTFARGSSLVGANEYSDKGLGFISKASQNIHIVYNCNRIDSIKIDLQDTKHIEGYNIEEELFASDAKSATDVKGKKAIYEVGI